VALRVRTHVRTGQAAAGQGGGGGLALNPTVLTGSGTFSNANATVLTTTGNTTVIGTVAMSGKKCFGSKIITAVANYGVIGLSRATGTSAGIGFDGSNSYGAYSNGSNFPGGGNGMSWAQGSDLCCLFDSAANLAWFTSDGVTFYGAATVTAAQVAAGTSGIDVSAITSGATIFPCVGSFTTAGWQFTYEAYPFTPPAGFTSM
jgi:hypothetical protein